jgi:hypothetical protein
MLPPPVKNLPFLLAASKEFQNERLRRGHRRGGFWQMACPHGILDNSLNIRRLSRARSRLGPAPQSKKMGKSRNLNRFWMEERTDWDGINIIGQD